MALSDKDLLSVQEARQAVERAFEAQKVWGMASQQQVDQVCAAMAQAAFLGAERLGRLAAEETGFGVPEHKKLKNEFASQHLWQRIQDIRTVGFVRKDEANNVYEIAWPMGVVAALIPSTNPTSTVMNKIMISVKARNGIVVAPHPTAVKCSLETAKVMIDAAEEARAPQGLINCLTHISLQGTQEMMAHKRTAVILATGGSEMVRVAHSQGKPAYGVGPGNVPGYVDRSADLTKLSGGEQQMLAMARVLRSGSRLLLLDEPSEGLAPVIVARIGEIIREIKAHGVAVLLVEQNVKFAATVADRHYLLAQGKVVEHLENDEFRTRERELLTYLGM